VIDAGVDGFLSKPIDWDHFSDEIAERLGKPRQDGELQPA
jgi:hypothetical protein